MNIKKSRRVAAVLIAAAMTMTVYSLLPFSAARAATAYGDVNKFPVSYQSKLAALKDKHPKWTFVPQNTGITWSTALSYEYSKGGNVYSSGGSWKKSSKNMVAYYFDPRNFLTETRVFQFLRHNFDSSTQTKTTVKQVAGSTFLNSAYYIDTIYSAGSAAGVNPNVLTAMIIQEQGTTGSSSLISGTYTVNSSTSIASKTTRSAVLRRTTYIRTGAGTGYKKAGKVKKNYKITVRGTKKDSKGRKWYKFNYKSKTRYAIASNIKIRSTTVTYSSAKKALTTAAVNVRSGPGTKYKGYGTLPKSKVVSVRGYKRLAGGSNWYKITYKSKTRYFSAKYARIYTTSYAGYYNYFNIGAYSANGRTAVQNGLRFARGYNSPTSTVLSTRYGRPWNSKTKAIKGGAQYYGTNYVKNNQNTLYLKKFNVMNGLSKVGTHQYMTHVAGAYGEGVKLARADDYTYVFYIPVFNSMPDDPCPYYSN